MLSLQKIIETTKASGGLTLNANLTQFRPKTGYMVSLLGYETKVSLKNIDSIQAKLDEYRSIVSAMLDATALDVKLGLWIDNDTLYIDVSQYVDDFELAMYLGKARTQLAIFDFSSNNVIRL